MFSPLFEMASDAQWYVSCYQIIKMGRIDRRVRICWTIGKEKFNWETNEIAHTWKDSACTNPVRWNAEIVAPFSYASCIFSLFYLGCVCQSKLSCAQTVSSFATFFYPLYFRLGFLLTAFHCECVYSWSASGQNDERTDRSWFSIHLKWINKLTTPGN